LGLIQLIFEENSKKFEIFATESLIFGKKIVAFCKFLLKKVSLRIRLDY